MNLKGWKGYDSVNAVLGVTVCDEAAWTVRDEGVPPRIVLDLLLFIAERTGHVT